MKNIIQQSNEKTRITHEERYEGSSQSNQETPSYADNINDSCQESDKSEINHPLQISHDLKKSFTTAEYDSQTNKSRSTFNNIINYDRIVHATFDKTGFLNPPTLHNSKNVSHNTSIETVVNQDVIQVPKSFMGVLEDAITIFSKAPAHNPIFELKPKEHKIRDYHKIMNDNFELREDNKTLVHENDDLKEDIDEKDAIVDKLNQKIQQLCIDLKECEIHLTHTTEMYAREKQEKENAYIAFNRILCNFTSDDINSAKFLQRNMQLASVSSPTVQDRNSSQGDYSTNMGHYHDEDDYCDKELLPNRRKSNSRMNTSSANGNQRTVYTNGTNLITGGGDTTSTVILNNESYDFNPRDMEEMDVLN
jgi:hypothetical protein